MAKRALMIAHEVGSPERQQAFDQWGGAPERWYHGTSKDVDFPKFKIGRHGAWFARDPKSASMYAENNDSQGYKRDGWNMVKTNTRSRVIPVHLKLGKSHTGPLPDSFKTENYKKAQSEWFDQLRAQGYDSWVPEGGDVAVVLKDPTQIKSAIGNRGTFDPNEADIGKAAGGSATKRALMIARDQRALLRRITNIYPGPGGGMDPSPGGGGYSGPGGGKYIGPSRYAEGGSVPPFRLHSGAAKLIAAKGQKKATPQQYAAMPGIKPDELKHSKFDTLGSKALPREEVIKHLEDNALPIEETQLGGEGRNTSTKFHDPKLQLPGGEKYREVLLHLPETRGTLKEYPVLRADGVSDGRYATQEAAERRAVEISGTVGEPTSTDVITGFRSAHWKEPDVLAHLRLTNRRGPNGEKILHLEEAQSDWGQKGRDQGFKTGAAQRYEDWRDGALERAKQKLAEKNIPEETAQNFLTAMGMGNRQIGHDVLAKFVGEKDHADKLWNEHLEDQQALPRGPYVDNTQKWTDLALKRVLHEAAHGGYDKIVVTPGDEQNKRYSLEKHVKNIQYYPDLGYLHATTHDNQGVKHENVKPEDLSKHIGKEAADRILKQGMQRYEGRGKLGGEFYHELEGDGLKVGGAGMRGYYDNILPKRLQALAQQHDPQAKVDLHAHSLNAAPDNSAVRQRAIISAHNVDDIDSPTEAAWNRLAPDLQNDHMEHARREQSERDLDVGDRPAPPAPLHSLDVTPQMRDSIKQGGFNSFKRGGDVGDPMRDVSDKQVRAALEKTVSPFSGDPEHVKEALRIASTFKVPTTTTSPGGYYNISQDRSPEEVAVKLAGLPGVTPKPVRKMSWEDLHKKGGSFVNLGGDRSTFGRLTRINGEPLAWPVDLHAGPNYMRELNPGLVWANAPGHATSLTNTIRRAADKGPVYGVYAPMGPRAVDSAHHMFDAVMAQIPGRDISKEDAAAFDAEIKQGMHMPIKKRPSASKALEKWPGILNAKEASEFARTLPGEQRSGILQHMDKKSWKDKGFPQIGVTRVAITDPDVFKASGNMLGHRVVQLDPSKMVEETKFKHGTYSAPTAGEYVGDVPLVQRHYAAPDVIEQRLMKPTVAGDIIHPYSASPVGRSSARKIFEEQKNIQPLNQRQLDSTMQGLERQKQYGLKTGGRVGYTPGGGVEQLQQNLRGAFSDLNRQVAAQGPQQQQQAMPQAPYGAYQRMEQQATGQAPNDAYQRMMAQALNGKTYEEMFPTTPKVAAPAPAVAPVQFAADAMPYYQTNYGPSPTEILGGDGTGSGDFKRGGRATNIVERALAITRRK